METELETALEGLLDAAIMLLAEPMRDMLSVALSRARERPKMDRIASRAVNDHIFMNDKSRARKKLVRKLVKKAGGVDGPGDEYAWSVVKLDLALDELLSLALRRLTKLRGSMLTAEEKARET